MVSFYPFGTDPRPPLSQSDDSDGRLERKSPRRVMPFLLFTRRCVDRCFHVSESLAGPQRRLTSNVSRRNVKAWYLKGLLFSLKRFEFGCIRPLLQLRLGTELPLLELFVRPESLFSLEGELQLTVQEACHDSLLRAAVFSTCPMPIIAAFSLTPVSRSTCSISQ